MTSLEIRTVVINQLARLLPIPVLPLRVDQHFRLCLQMTGSPRGDPASSAYNTRVSAHRHPDLGYSVEEVSHGHATRLLFQQCLSQYGNDVTHRVATRASIELNGLCASPIRSIKEGNESAL